MKIKVLLVSKNEKNLTMLRQHLQDEDITIAAEVSDAVTALNYVENSNPDLVIISMADGDQDALNLAERIITYRPKNFVILVAGDLSVETMQAAVGVGAHNITALPETEKEFTDYVKRVYNSENLRVRSLTERQNIAWSSQVITVFSSKGGLGKTTVAVNTAVALAEKGKKVALIDLDLQFGDVPIFLDLDPNETIAELVQDMYSPSIDTIRSYMVVHSSGVHVLCAPRSPEYAEIVSAEKVQSLLSLMRAYYDYIIIDTSSTFNDITLTAIEAANTVFFITGLDVSILKNSRLSVNLLDSLQQKEKIRVMVNRAVEMNSISLADVERVLHLPIYAALPSDYVTAVNALNKGVPFVTGVPASRLCESIQELTSQLLGSDAAVPVVAARANKKGFKLFGRKKTDGVTK